MKAPEVYAVDNFSKFLALVTLGVPPMSPDGHVADKNHAPEWREITNEELEQHGFATLEDAEAAGFEGTICYGIGAHADRKRIAKAFDTAHHTPKENIEIPDVLDLRTSKGQAKAIELMAAVIALAFRNRKFFNDRRTQVRARLKLKKGPDSFAIIDRRSSDEVIERFST
jgi:hypothetical protein